MTMLRPKGKFEKIFKRVMKDAGRTFNQPRNPESETKKLETRQGREKQNTFIGY